MSLILVVEDEPVNQALVTRFLRNEGYDVLLAKDGLEGVKTARERIPDLIVMDLGLPGLNGWEAARRIRLSSKTAHIPIIALTGSTNAENVLKAKQAGCDAYETKPVVHKRLIAKIRQLLGADLPEPA
ncbi:MAG: response regulator [Bryobacteraceae bacterium]|jgi:two-component system cell cycle response regulator DivK